MAGELTSQAAQREPGPVAPVSPRPPSAGLARWNLCLERALSSWFRVVGGGRTLQAAGVVTQGARGHSESQGSQATRDGYFCGSAEERGTEDTRNGR